MEIILAWSGFDWPDDEDTYVHVIQHDFESVPSKSSDVRWVRSWTTCQSSSEVAAQDMDETFGEGLFDIHGAGTNRCRQDCTDV